ncbi:MAG: 4-alpha-glucanotransferase, partial [Pseudomonadota bacterium]
GTADNVTRDLLRVALHSDARYAIAPMQDLLDLPSDARFNTPGTTQGNWLWRLRAPAFTDALCQQIRDDVQASGRLPPR